MDERKNITIVGTGFVGMSLAVLLAQQNNVIALDIDANRVAKVNANLSTVVDSEIEEFLQTKQLALTATTNAEDAYQKAEFIIVATPTDYNPETNFFDTNSVEKVIGEALYHNKNSLIVIKSAKITN